MRIIRDRGVAQSEEHLRQLVREGEQIIDYFRAKAVPRLLDTEDTFARLQASHRTLALSTEPTNFLDRC